MKKIKFISILFALILTVTPLATTFTAPVSTITAEAACRHTKKKTTWKKTASSHTKIVKCKSCGKVLSKKTSSHSFTLSSLRKSGKTYVESWGCGKCHYEKVYKYSDGKATKKGKRVATYAKNNKSTQPAKEGYSAAWVSGVIQAAGYGYPKASAIEFWTKFHKKGSTSMKNIPIGAIVVGSGVGPMGRLYGHCGIYLGNGMVANVTTGFATDTLGHWLCWQTAKCAREEAGCKGKRGWIGWVKPY